MVNCPHLLFAFVVVAVILGIVAAATTEDREPSEPNDAHVGRLENAIDDLIRRVERLEN